MIFFGNQFVRQTRAFRFFRVINGVDLDSGFLLVSLQHGFGENAVLRNVNRHRIAAGVRAGVCSGVCLITRCAARARDDCQQNQSAQP